MKYFKQAMASLGDLLKMSMFFQVLNTTGNSFRPLLAFIGLNLYERGFALYPSWLSSFKSTISSSIDGDDRKPSAVIECERGPPPPTKGGSAPLFMTRMDAVIHYVACSPATKRLLSIASHDYLPYEFEAVKLDEDIYFKLTHVDVDDGNIKNIKFQIFCYNHPIQTLQKFVDSCNQDYERRMLNKLGNDLYFFDQMVDNKKQRKSNQNPLPTSFLVYTKHKFSTTRTFENVYFDQQKEVQKRVQFFLEKRSWYEKKGIPYTLGFLFHGDPGTGKTSEIKAIANVARRHPVNVQLSEIKTKTQLRHLFFSDDLHVYNGNTLEKYTIPISERLYIIEDADAMGDVLLKREWKRPEPVQTPKDPFAPELDDDIIKDPIDLSFLLNLLDGTLESSGRIMVFTSNFPERFDRALIRPGRIDMIVHFKKCSRKILKEMIEGFYDIADIDHPLFADSAMDEKWSPAEVNQILFRNFENSAQAMDELHTLNASTPLLEQGETTAI